LKIRDWREFRNNALRSLRHVFWSTALVPPLVLLMYPKINEPGYWEDLLCSTRIGFQIALTYWLIMTAIYAYVFQNSPEDLANKKSSVKFQIVTGIPIMLFGIWWSSLVEPYISGEHFLLEGWTTGILIGGVTFSIMVLYFAYKRTAEHNLKLKVESAESNLNVLKNQMQPHFLFNSLNSLSELIESDKAEASVMVQKLSDLYRQILENSKNPLATLASEITIIEKYLELEKLRFGERLRYNIVSPDNSDEIFIPSLTLQTLVENAIKHGISQAVEGGEVVVSVEGTESGYQVRIMNTGTAKQRKSSKPGTGIENTKSRLNLLYGDRHQFNLVSEDNKTVASFWFHGVPSVT
jgi:hypothetical protein